MGSVPNFTRSIEIKHTYPRNPKQNTQSHSKQQMKVNYVTTRIKKSQCVVNTNQSEDFGIRQGRYNFKILENLQFP
jgi:hypothetical protein